MKWKHTSSPSIAAIAALALATLSSAPAQAEVYKADPRDEIKFEIKRWAKNFIHIENGPITVTTIKDEAWSSRWYLEPVGFGDFVRLKNRWKGCYINVENGPVECGAKDNGDNTGGRWSAQWRVVYEGDGDYAIVNRWTECRLSTGYLKNMRCSKDNATAGEDTEYLWRSTNLTNLTIAPTPAAPPEIDDSVVVSFRSTDGGDFDSFTISEYTQRARLSSDFDEDIEIISIYGQYATVIGYENPNFTGRTVTLRCGFYELIGDPENEISSIRVIRAVRPEASCPSHSEGYVEIHNWD